MISFFGWVAGELLLEWRRQRRLRALIARPTFVREEEVVMPRSSEKVPVIVEFEPSALLHERVEVLRQTKIAALRAGAREVDIGSALAAVVKAAGS